ncbi:MAG: hypothetical protein IH949_07150 [Bacteroidetes bacterium]|nr:hypothetical protein [Bacteroidota bacterium]
MVPGKYSLNTLKEGLIGHPKKSFSFFIHLTNGKGHGAISVISMEPDSHIDSDNITFFQDMIAGDPVNNLFIDRGTDGSRIAPVSLEGGLSS